MIRYLQKLAEFDAWANEALITSLASLPAASPSDSRLLAVFSHIGAAKLVWLDRISHGATQVEIWPQLDLPGASAQVRRADERLVALTQKLTLTEITRPVLYRTTKGHSYATALIDVIIHMVNHATYHRGQLANLIKAAGGTPAVTDYIAWVRR